MFIGTMWASTYKHHVNRPIILVAISLFILSTAHIVVNIIRLENGFVKYRNTFPGGPAAFFQDISQPTFFVKNMIYGFQTMLGDGVLIYRCYVVWQSIGIIILPSLLWCSCSAATLIAIFDALQANGGNVFTGQTRVWVVAMVTLTLSTNLISSGLVAYRIWMMERKVSTMRATSDTLMPIVRVLVDATIIYSGMLLVMLICFVSDNNVQFIIQDMIMPIIPIAFYMVFIRITFRNITHSDLSTVYSAGSNERESSLRHHPTQPLQFICPDGRIRTVS
ncbi:hypothetical protein BDR03DRAFT_132341 [Suillus americanus]|nr:hypothetical protein BDR03DRAFT_132341 [Suillus americanus]